MELLYQKSFFRVLILPDVVYFSGVVLSSFQRLFFFTEQLSYQRDFYGVVILPEVFFFRSSYRTGGFFLYGAIIIQEICYFYSLQSSYNTSSLFTEQLLYQKVFFLCSYYHTRGFVYRTPTYCTNIISPINIY